MEAGRWEGYRFWMCGRGVMVDGGGGFGAAEARAKRVKVSVKRVVMGFIVDVWRC
jgi:hypothetical protein